MANEQQQVFQWMTAGAQTPEEMYATGPPQTQYGLSYNPETNTITHGEDNARAAQAIKAIGMSMRVWTMAVSQKWPEFIGVQIPQGANPGQSLPITCALMEFEDDRTGVISWIFNRFPKGNVTDLTRQRIEKQLRNCYREIAYGQDGVANQDVLKIIDETVELRVMPLAN